MKENSKNNASMLQHTEEYIQFISELKKRIQIARQKAVLSVNKELIILYWEIGTTIVQKQKMLGWGSKIIDTLSKDLQKSFPEMKGFSPRNLKYMRKFAESYPEFKFVQEVLAQLTWYHNITLLEKIPDADIRNWYLYKTIENGWSRNVLVHQIESGLYERQEKNEKSTNFLQTLPKPQSELALQTLKDPYIFDFLTISEKTKEKEIENQLIRHITQFLLELGAGFSYVGNQYHLEIAEKDYYIDLLFYHLKLRCFVVIEIKTGDFKPEYAGKINFYLSAVDDLLKHSRDNPSIGILLCKTKNKVVVEYALRDMTKPIGVAEYKIGTSIPSKFKGSLPTVEELEAELGQVLNESEEE